MREHLAAIEAAGRTKGVLFTGIAHTLDLGRRDQVSLVYDRRASPGADPTPGQFRARVMAEGVTPSLHVHYRRSRSSGTARK